MGTRHRDVGAPVERGAATVAVATVAAVAAAFFNGLAAFLQQGAAKRLDSADSVPPRQFVRLVRQPRWIAGQSSDAFAFVLQALALAFGALIFVEPLLVLSLPFAVVLQAWAARQSPGRHGVVGTVLCILGLSVFLLVAQPTAGTSTPSLAEALPLGVGLLGVLGLCLGTATATGGNVRAVAFAAGAAATFGVTAGLTKVVTTRLQDGLLEPLLHWEVYGAVVTGVAGVLLTQNALKPGALAAPVAVITVGDPLAGIAVGLLWLGERVNSSPAAIAGQVVTLAVMALGVAVLAGQSRSAAAPVE